MTVSDSRVQVVRRQEAKRGAMSLQRHRGSVAKTEVCRKPLKHRRLKENHASITLYACRVHGGNTAPNLPPSGGGAIRRGGASFLASWLRAADFGPTKQSSSSRPTPLSSRSVTQALRLLPDSIAARLIRRRRSALTRVTNCPKPLHLAVYLWNRSGYCSAWRRASARWLGGVNRHARYCPMRSAVSGAFPRATERG